MGVLEQRNRERIMEVAGDFLRQFRAGDRDEAVNKATTDLVAAAVFLESAIGPNRTRRVLLAAAEAIGPCRGQQH